MMSSTRVLAALCAAAWAGMSSAQTCVYEWTDPDTQAVWTWDFSALASTDGYTVNYPMTWDGVTYTTNDFTINLCQNAPVTCLPEGYKADATSGVAVQTWGTTPTCQHDGATEICVQGEGGTVRGQCCTQDCAVLSTNPVPEFVEPYDKTKLGQGSDDGVKLQFETIESSNVNRSICEFGTPRLAVMYTLFCDPTVTFESLEVLHQGCEFNIVAQSKYACAQQVTSSTHGTTHATTNMTTSSTTTHHEMSGGSVFLLILFIISVLYFGVGTIIVKFTQGVWMIPNKLMWVSLGGLIAEGGRFIARGCKKDPASGYGTKANTAGYVDNDNENTDYSEFGNNSAAASATSSSGAVPQDDLYDDL